MTDRPTMLLVLLAEECVEVAQRCTKAIRFGLDEIQEGQALTNAERLRQELNDLDSVRAMLEQEVGTDLSPCPQMIEAKLAKVEKYLGYSAECGQLRTVDPPNAKIDIPRPRRRWWPWAA